MNNFCNFHPTGLLYRLEDNIINMSIFNPNSMIFGKHVP